MKATEALGQLMAGGKVKTMFDGTEVFYQMFKGDDIARMVTTSYCTAETVAWFTPSEFLDKHKNITMVETKI